MYYPRFSSCWVALLVLSICGVQAQSGRFEQQKRLGLAYIKSGRFDEAAAKLEEVWDTDKSDSLVGESLALAYLNGSDRRNNPQYSAMAYQLMDKSLQDGGRAVFLVKHSHEKLGFLRGGAVTNFCAGQLVVQKNRVTYVGDVGKEASQHSFDLSAGDIVDASPDPGHEGGAFHLRTREKTYGFALRNADDEDVKFLSKLIHNYVVTSGQ